MKNMTPLETSALAAFVEQSLQCLAVRGSHLTGPALVAALDPGAIPPDLSRAYLKLRAAPAS